MKYIFPLLLLPFLICAFAQSGGKKKKKPVQTFTITGTVFEKQDYCGGAVPRYDQINPAPSPAVNLTLYIKRGNVNAGSKIVDSVKTDQQGKFSVQLAAGDYCFVESWKKNKLVLPKSDQYNTWDTACYRKNYSACDYALQVTKDDSLKFSFQRHCPWGNPCSQYHGPLPPAAHPGNPNQPKPQHQE